MLITSPLQVINTLNATVPLTVDITQTFTGVNGTILTAADLNSYNYVNNQTEVVPKALALNSTISSANSTNGTGSSWSWDVPKWSITVLQFDL